MFKDVCSLANKLPFPGKLCLSAPCYQSLRYCVPWTGDRPFLISGADDKLIKVWDYQTKACVQTLEGHTHNVSAVCFHPELPIILTGSEDGTLRIWHAMTYRLENTLNYGMERLWSLGYVKGSNRCDRLACGYLRKYCLCGHGSTGAL
jgi:WD40 repeat protein